RLACFRARERTARLLENALADSENLVFVIITSIKNSHASVAGGSLWRWRRRRRADRSAPPASRGGSNASLRELHAHTLIIRHVDQIKRYKKTNLSIYGAVQIFALLINANTCNEGLSASYIRRFAISACAKSRHNLSMLSTFIRP